MSEVEIDLLSVDRGIVTAPAGCGKTQLIASAVMRSVDKKPILVLTHTNAGVVALRQRLETAGVRVGAYRLSTLDGWAMKIASKFPTRSGINPSVLKLGNPRSDYPNIRNAAISLVGAGHIHDVLRASFSRLLVDEYQDCSIRQHRLVSHMSEALSTCVLGDQLQAIFGFGDDGLADWDSDVCSVFPVVGELTVPWRWINAQAEPLGKWLLEVRKRLLQRLPINLRDAPGNVRWVKLDGSDDYKIGLVAAGAKPPDDDGRVLIIGDSTSPQSQRRVASQTPGAVTIEAVDLRDLVDFANGFDLSRDDIFIRLVKFSESVMTNVGGDDLIRRVDSIKSGRSRKEPTNAEIAALKFLNNPSFSAAADVLVEINRESGVRAHRPAILRSCLKAFRLCTENSDLSFYDAVVHIREQNRFVGRPLPKRAVGSTLLLKGLEAEVVVVLNADSLDARNLYVALTRGSKSVVVCSRSSTLRPA